MKVLLLVALLLASVSLSAQRANKSYKLYYVDSVYRSIANVGCVLRNDTLYISTASPINIVAVITEDSSLTARCIALRSLREATKPKVVTKPVKKQ